MRGCPAKDTTLANQRKIGEKWWREARTGHNPVLAEPEIWLESHLSEQRVHPAKKTFLHLTNVCMHPTLALWNILKSQYMSTKFKIHIKMLVPNIHIVIYDSRTHSH